MGALATGSPWSPQHDLLLKNAVGAGASFESLPKGAVNFSQRFTIRELQNRWHALLDDPVVSAEASRRQVFYYDQNTIKVLLGITAENCVVDIDLAREGRADKVSRRQFAVAQWALVLLFGTSMVLMGLLKEVEDLFVGCPLLGWMCALILILIHSFIIVNLNKPEDRDELLQPTWVDKALLLAGSVFALYGVSDGSILALIIIILSSCYGVILVLAIFPFLEVVFTYIVLIGMLLEITSFENLSYKQAILFVLVIVFRARMRFRADRAAELSARGGEGWRRGLKVEDV